MWNSRVFSTRVEVENLICDGGREGNSMLIIGWSLIRSVGKVILINRLAIVGLLREATETT